MKVKFNIDHIRLLLHSYYEGKTTPEEELHLEAFFRDTPAWEIPESMAVDRKVFSSVASLHPVTSEMEIPDDLFEKVSEISSSCDAKHTKKTQRNRATRIQYALAAACACLILTFGIRRMNTPTDIHTKTFEYMSESPTKLSEPPSKAAPEEETMPDASKTPSSSISNTQRKDNTITENEIEPNRLEDGFIEITDPEEAEKIVLEIGRLLASNTQKTNEAIQHLEKTVDEYKEITKSILQ